MLFVRWLVCCETEENLFVKSRRIMASTFRHCKNYLENLEIKSEKYHN